jgi:hypothetical protein
MPRKKRKNATPLLIQSLIGPGFSGLNTELQPYIGVTDPSWALALENAVWDSRGRVSMRKGYTVLTTTPITAAPTIKVLHEYLHNDGVTQLIAFTSTFGVWESSDDGATWSDITGAISSTTSDWIFVNFNGNCYATAGGHKVWEYTGSSTFTQVTDSNVTNGTLLAAFGRLWAGRDASTAIDYSALLGGTDWSGSGSGSIDTANVWTQGYDNVRGLYAFGSTFVVFGRNHIIMYVDGTGSVLGIDPNNMYVVDTIEGTGLEFRDSVVNIGEGDMLFVSANGVQSLARVVQDKANPLVSVSNNQRSLVDNYVANQVGETNSVQAIFSPENHFCLFLFTGDDEILHYDTSFQLQQDGSYRASQWTGITAPQSMCVRRDGTVLYGLTGGEVAKYDAYTDDSTGAATKYSLVYGTPWIDGGEHNKLKIVKGFYATFYGRETLTATARWGFNYRPLEFTETFTNDFNASGAEWGVGEFGTDEFATGLRWRRQYVAGSGEGQFVQFYVSIQSTDVDEVVSIQEMGMLYKLGRMV